MHDRASTTVNISRAAIEEQLLLELEKAVLPPPSQNCLVCRPGRSRTRPDDVAHEMELLGGDLRGNPVDEDMGRTEEGQVKVGKTFIYS